MRIYEDTFSGEKIYPGKVRTPDWRSFAIGGEKVQLGQWHIRMKMEG